MPISLCITNERLTAVCGAASLKQGNIQSFASASIVDGALLNGIITDERLVTIALDELRSKLPKNSLQGVRIALRTSFIYAKRMAVPHLPRKKMLGWIEGAFSDVGAREALYYDYMVLEQEKMAEGQVALLCAAQKAMIGSLAKYFEKQKY